jgi:hypothetical protein
MKKYLQHLLHPLNLWSRLGGKFTTAFKFYEDYCWQPFLRRWLNNEPGICESNDSQYALNESTIARDNLPRGCV